jgi:hypothetical protein
VPIGAAVRSQNALYEIIVIATDDHHSLSILLRKCLVLSYELKDDRLNAWANEELNGYESVGELPEYRIAGAGATGNFTGSVGRTIYAYPVPSLALDEKHRKFAEEAPLMQAIRGYECVVPVSAESNIKLDWNENLTLFYQEHCFSRPIRLGFRAARSFQANLS